MWAPSCFHGSVGQGWEVVEKYIQTQDTHHAKNAGYRPRTYTGFVTEGMRSISCSPKAMGQPNFFNAEFQAHICEALINVSLLEFY